MHISSYSPLASVFLRASAWAQIQGTVTGTVLEAGRPLVKAKVHIAEKGPFVGHRLVQYHETDDTGQFRIAHVPWGTYGDDRRENPP